MKHLRHLWTHRHGTCQEDGCDKPSLEGWISTCAAHYTQRMTEAAQARADAKFAYDVAVTTEALKRTGEHYREYRVTMDEGCSHVAVGPQQAFDSHELGNKVETRIATPWQEYKP